MALSRRAAGQGIVLALVQAANSSAVIPLLVDFETGAQEKLRRELFDCEPDGVRRVPKPFVPDGTSAGFMFATGEQLRRGVIIKLDDGLPGRLLFERNFFDHELFSR